MSTLVYLIGAPAAGKSTLMAALTRGCDRLPVARPVPHDRLADPRSGDPVGAEIGRRRNRFSGTDALAMNASPACCAWVASRHAPVLLLGEGDRLAHAGFLAAAADGGYSVHVLHVTCPPGLLEQRYAARAAQGHTQNPVWRAGRATKAVRLAEVAAARYRLTELPSTDPAATVRAARAAVPALAALPE
jgi:hypothetical protein